MTQGTPQNGSFGWRHFVARSGSEGRLWEEQYRPADGLEELSTRALQLLRRGLIPEGYALLEQMRAAMRAGGPEEPAARSVVERWYHGVLGYYFYCTGQAELAEDAMLQAHHAVTAAISTRRFLLPLANHCHEFRLHRARIARNRARWPDMRAHVEQARGMMAGGLPLCVLEDGTRLRIADICAFYAAIPALTDAERASLEGLLDEDTRLRAFEQFVYGMYRIPGIVLQYP